jgi:hypothetical protein
MPSVFAPTDAIYSLFRTLTHQALEQRPDSGDMLAIGSFNYAPEEGGFLVKLYLDKSNEPFEVGYLPKTAREKRGAIAKFCAANERQPRLFEPSSLEGGREHLKTLLWACDHDREGLVDVKLPVENPEEMLPSIERAVADSKRFSASSAKSSAIAVPFEVLAHDILSGKPQPHQHETKLTDTYEVWASRENNVACIAVRHFDFGTALAVAALVPHDMENQIDFDEAAYLLIQSLIDPAIASPAAPVFRGLRLLEGAEITPRLQAALALCATDTGLAYEPGLTGFPSAETLAYLNTFAHLVPARSEPDEPLDTPDFERMARLRLLAKKEYTWSAEKEAQDQARIEFLEHLDFKGGYVLVQIEPNHESIYVSAFCPDAWDDTIHDAFLEEVRLFGVIRKFDTQSPVPRLASSRFKQVPGAGAESLLREFSELPDANDGCYHDLDPLDFAAPVAYADAKPAIAFNLDTTPVEFANLLVRPRGTSLH